MPWAEATAGSVSARERHAGGGAEDAAGRHGRERYGAGPKARPVIRRQMSSVRYFVHFWIVSTVCVLATAPSNVVV